MSFGRLNLGLGLGGSRGGILPLIGPTGEISPTEYDNSLIDYDSGGLYIDITYANQYAYDANEMVFYIGDGGSFNNRLAQTQWNGSGALEAQFRYRVRDDGTAVAENNKNFGQSYISLRQKHGFYYDYATGTVRFYANGIEIASSTGLNLPTSTAMKICAGKITGLDTIDTSGTINDFAYYDKTASAKYIREKTRNLEILDGVAGDSDRIAIVKQGQSNSSDRNAPASAPTYTNLSLMKNLKNDGTYAAFSNPSDDDTNTIINNSLLSDTTPETGYTGYLLDLIAGATGNETFSCHANKGGTSMAVDWRLKSGGVTSAPNGTGNPAFDWIINDMAYAAITRALMAKQAAGGNIPIIVWNQGESDAILGTSKTDYKTYFTEFHTEQRAAVGNYPLLINTLHAWDEALESSLGITEAAWGTITDALTELASEFPNSYLVDISDLAGETGDEVHFSDATSQEVAARNFTVGSNNGLF